MRRTIEVDGVRLEEWIEHGAWYEVGRTDPIRGGVIGSLYAPAWADGSAPTSEEFCEITETLEDAVGAGRELSTRLRAACLTNGSHRVEGEGAWCETCDSGDCPDCHRPTFYDADVEDYRHLEEEGRGCFLVAAEA